MSEEVRNVPATALMLAGQEIHQLKAELALATAEKAAQMSALQRLYENAQHIFAKRSVRDWGETLAEAAAVLADPNPAAEQLLRERRELERIWPWCLFDHNQRAVAIYHLPQGCACYPDERFQALCAQHAYDSEALGGMELVYTFDPTWPNWKSGKEAD